jgi:hypothetical protein
VKVTTTVNKVFCFVCYFLFCFFYFCCCVLFVLTGCRRARNFHCPNKYCHISGVAWHMPSTVHLCVCVSAALVSLLSSLLVTNHHHTTRPTTLRPTVVTPTPLETFQLVCLDVPHSVLLQPTLTPHLIAATQTADVVLVTGAYSFHFIAQFVTQLRDSGFFVIAPTRRPYVWLNSGLLVASRRSFHATFHALPSSMALVRWSNLGVLLATLTTNGGTPFTMVHTAAHSLDGYTRHTSSTPTTTTVPEYVHRVRQQHQHLHPNQQSSIRRLGTAVSWTAVGWVVLHQNQHCYVLFCVHNTTWQATAATSLIVRQ